MQLDPQQQACIDAPLGPLAIVAGPGAGKTRTVVARIAALVERGEVTADRVLALTHTTKAAGELRDRLRQTGVHGVHVATVHAMALKQVRRFAPLLGGEPPKLAGSSWPLVKDAARAELGVVDTATVSELAGEIDWAAALRVPAGGYEEAARTHGRTTSVAAGQVDAVRERYRAVKADAGVIDFADLLEAAVAQMDHPEVRSRVRAAFAAVFIDEYQDIDPLQQAVVDAWLDGRDCLCVVGDADQGVFRFKGGDPDLLLGFARRYPGATVVDLVRNYRSSAEIVSWVNRLALHKRVPLVAAAPAGPSSPPVVRAAPTEEAEEQALVRQLRAWHTSGVPYAEMAVLYRFNAAAARVEAALTAAGIPYDVAGAQRFFERPEVLEVLTPFGRAARAQPDEDGLTVLSATATQAGFDPERPPAGMGPARMRWEAVAALVALVAEQYATVPAGELLAALQERARESHDIPAGGVTLATAHAAKGREWDAVWVLGAVEGAFPSVYATTRAQLDEEQHLFYVALSRARRHLVVSCAQRRHNNFRSEPSRFLALVGFTGADPARRPSSGWSGRPSRSGSSAGHRGTRGSGNQGRGNQGRGNQGRGNQGRGNQGSGTGGGWSGAGRDDAPPTVASDVSLPTRQCGRCGSRLAGLAATVTKRCSPGCLDVADRRRFDALVAWREEYAARQGVAPAAVASDKALFTMCAARRATDVAGLHVPPTAVPPDLLGR